MVMIKNCNSKFSTHNRSPAALRPGQFPERTTLSHTWSLWAQRPSSAPKWHCSPSRGGMSHGLRHGPNWGPAATCVQANPSPHPCAHGPEVLAGRIPGWGPDTRFPGCSRGCYGGSPRGHPSLPREHQEGGAGTRWVLRNSLLGKREAKCPKGERTFPWLPTSAEQACDLSPEICGPRGQRSSQRKREEASQLRIRPVSEDTENRVHKTEGETITEGLTDSPLVMSEERAMG